MRRNTTTLTWHVWCKDVNGWRNTLRDGYTPWSPMTFYKIRTLLTGYHVEVGPSSSRKSIVVTLSRHQKGHDRYRRCHTDGSLWSWPTGHWRNISKPRVGVPLGRRLEPQLSWYTHHGKEVSRWNSLRRDLIIEVEEGNKGRRDSHPRWRTSTTDTPWKCKGKTGYVSI